MTLESVQSIKQLNTEGDQLKANLMLVLTAALLSVTAQAQVKSLKFTTLNIEWYGLGGDINGNPSKEHRDQYLKDFFKKEVTTSDVVAFEEIVDVARLERLLPDDWTCVSYDSSNPKHQHVVLCTSGAYDFANVEYDDNATIETVSDDNFVRARPAVRVNLIDSKSKKILATVVGVHLKSQDVSSDIRKHQMEMIAADLYQLPKDRPFVIMGDMNTYDLENSDFLTVADKYTLEKALQAKIGSAKLVDHTEKYTFKNHKHESQFDHFLINNFTPVGAPHVFEVCNNPNSGSKYLDLNFYNRNISDHCPTTVELQF